MKTFQLSTSFSMPAENYAGQGNAVIGIRDAGKTYTAMKAAEQLLDAGIPIIVYDPVGVWKNLKNGTGKHAGYQVVVAGGAGSDIILTPANAVDIVRAAMKENVSLVIDLYSPELINKSTWIKVVQETVDILMYENKAYNLRHIFLEEAAEFIPQRLQPQHARVYASLERLARMGRNARLGMTIINQRAEEVNKAILEICEFTLLHKQVGKNSLKSIQQWLELSQVDNAKDIIKSLPGLKQGECWAIGHSSKPQLIKVAPRNTFHPNPKSNEVYTNAQLANVSNFVTKLNKLLQRPTDAKAAPHLHAGQKETTLVKEIVYLQEELQKANKEKLRYKELFNRSCQVFRSLSSSLAKELEGIYESEVQTSPTGITCPVKEAPAKLPQSPQPVTGNPVTGGAMRMLKAAAMFLPAGITKPQIATLADLSHTSGSFGTYMGTLKREGLIQFEGGLISVTNEGSKQAGAVERYPRDPKQRIEVWCNAIGANSGASRMLRLLGSKYPNSMTRQDLGDAIEMSATSGSFGTYIGTLKRNGLIETEKGFVKASHELFK
jgi:hypothetical protein